MCKVYLFKLTVFLGEMSFPGAFCTGQKNSYAPGGLTPQSVIKQTIEAATAFLRSQKKTTSSLGEGASRYDIHNIWDFLTPSFLYPQTLYILYVYKFRVVLIPHLCERHI